MTVVTDLDSAYIATRTRLSTRRTFSSCDTDGMLICFGGRHLGLALTAIVEDIRGAVSDCDPDGRDTVTTSEIHVTD